MIKRQSNLSFKVGVRVLNKLLKICKVKELEIIINFKTQTIYVSNDETTWQSPLEKPEMIEYDLENYYNL